jgi:anthranilate phosphoribosyltransferase
VLDGEKGPARDIVCLNAAAAIVAGGKAGDIRRGWTLAQESIDSGSARGRLDALVEATKA